MRPIHQLFFSLLAILFSASILWAQPLTPSNQTLILKNVTVIADPSQDILNTRKIEFVIKGGKVHKREKVVMP